MTRLFGGDLIQRIRLFAGLILFTYALTHFLNHAVGLIGLEAMHKVQEWRILVTRSLIGGLLITGALLAHMVISLWRLADRKTLRMPAWQAIQIGTGLLIPFYLLPHYVFTRVAHQALGVNDIYAYELLLLWPSSGWTMSLTLLVVWVHGCIGLHYWLRLTDWYGRIQQILLGCAVAVPILALAGFVTAGRDVQFIASDPDMMSEIRDVSNFPEPEGLMMLQSWSYAFQGLFYLAVLALLLIYAWRIYLDRIQHRFDITYVDGPVVRIPAGPSLLEASRMNSVPHASVCGGRARCSTCRVRIHDGGADLPHPDDIEQRTLASVNAPPDVRLACQIHPVAPITVTRIVRSADEDEDPADRRSADSRGVERDMAILFLDVRGFTQLSDKKLPYDVVYILNQFFDVAGRAIREEGGWIDKYLGDGLMAVFGRIDGPERGSEQALRAAVRIDEALDRLNDRLHEEIGAPIKIGIGIHVGPVVLGEIGFKTTASMTVIGRTVNAASRLEALSKEKASQLVISTDTARAAGLSTEGLEAEEVAVRGLSAPLPVYAFKRSRDLSERLKTGSD